MCIASCIFVLKLVRMCVDFVLITMHWQRLWAKSIVGLRTPEVPPGLLYVAVVAQDVARLLCCCCHCRCRCRCRCGCCCCCCCCCGCWLLVVVVVVVLVFVFVLVLAVAVAVAAAAVVVVVVVAVVAGC